MLTTLLYISLISGGILVFMVLLSFLGGLDFDIDFGEGDDGGGVIKGVLTFFSVGAYIWRGFLMADTNPLLSLAAGLIAGTIAVIVLISFLRWIMRQQENVNWSLEDALFEKGKVYLKIPVSGSGIVQVTINGVNREFKAKSSDEKEIPTGAIIQVESIEDEFAIVTTNF
ncbi:MAG: hypothetical protein P1U56_04275 [Saprospiraceae bacterium]|nr:hypothetical protein [Saprospiraceae bacterium]